MPADRRRVDGIVLLDKPAGISSNRALQQVRHLYRARKAGHAGTLDPFATGMLPLCLGEATKFSGTLLEAAKGYRASCRLGMSTTTGDPEGQVLETVLVPELSDARIEQALAGLVGEIEQIPPMYSALKHRGKRLYRLAREGREVERPARRVRIHEFELLARNGPLLELQIACSKGTYIRTLVEDLGRQLGTVAHTVALRRTWVGPFAEAAMHTLEALQEMADAGALERLLLPVDAALQQLPAVHLEAVAARRLRHGQAVSTAAARQHGRVRLYAEDGKFLGVGELGDDGMLLPVRLIACSQNGDGAGSA